MFSVFKLWQTTVSVCWPLCQSFTCMDCVCVRKEERSAHWIGGKTGSSSVRNTKGSSLKPKSFIFFEGGGLQQRAKLIRTPRRTSRVGMKEPKLTQRASPTHSVFLHLHLQSAFRNGVSLGRCLSLSLATFSLLLVARGAGGLFTPKLEEGEKARGGGGG